MRGISCAAAHLPSPFADPAVLRRYITALLAAAKSDSLA
jgi:hypothetical protein